MAGKNVAGRLQKLIVAYSALGILATGTLVAVVSAVPVYHHLKQDEERNLLLAVRTRTLAVEEYLRRAKDIAQQIASRTELRKHLEAYSQKKLSLKQLVNLSLPKLTDALNQSQELAGITRLDVSGKLAVRVGLPVPAEFWPVPDADSQEAKVYGPVTLEGATYLVVGVPILSQSRFPDSSFQSRFRDSSIGQSRRVGTDIVLFKLDRLQQIVADNLGLGQTGETVLGTVITDGVQLFFPLRENKGRSVAVGQMVGQMVGDKFETNWSQISADGADGGAERGGAKPAAAAERARFPTPNPQLPIPNSQSLIPKTSLLGIALQKAVAQNTGILWPSGAGGGAEIVAYSPISDSEWGLAVTVADSELYGPIYRQIAATGTAIVVLVLLGTGGTAFLLRSLAGKAIVRAAELEQMVEQKTASLETEQQCRISVQEALREWEERYAIAAAGANDGLWDWNLETSEVYFSPRWKATLGYGENEIGTHFSEWFNRVHPDDVERLKAEITVHFAGLTSHLRNEHRISHKDGTYRWVLCRGVAIRNTGDKAYRMAGSMTDITAHKAAEEENIRLAAFPRNDPNPVLASDRKGNLIYINPAAQRVLAQLGVEEATGFLPANHPKLVRRCLETGQGERQIEATVGSRIFSWTYHPIPALDVVHMYATDITERLWAEEQLLHAAWHDGLTGTPNRNKFIHQLSQTVERAKQRPDDLFAVLFLDLDRFKVVNDSLGHSKGDQFLVAVARRLEACLRPGDLVARLGGDEFTILLSAISDISDATGFAERIQLELMLPVNLSGHEVFTTASIGIAIGAYRLGPSQSEPVGRPYEQPEDILRDADLAMYRAKALGKARHVVFDTAMHERAVALLQLENDLRRAIQENCEGSILNSELTGGGVASGRAFPGESQWEREHSQLLLYYQPVVALDTGRIAGFEALARWRHPERGLISPAEFIPVAEETGMIVPLGAWVLFEACQQLRRWQEQFPDRQELTMSVNLSGKQLSQPDLLPQIDAILRQTGISPTYLKLEITESVLMENAAAAAEVLEKLRDRNIGLCVDDFGTGYSSLSYLHRFPINTLKIDKSFVIEMAGDDENSEIVRAIVTLAHNLGMYVVAEGVETEKQLVQLWALQCEYGQGYFFSKPLRAEDAEALLANNPQW
jgi:diguanylate cyclase (GGDEF)-like protein/PAS domain S-box-containing protein